MCVRTVRFWVIVGVCMAGPFRLVLWVPGCLGFGLGRRADSGDGHDRFSSTGALGHESLHTRAHGHAWTYTHMHTQRYSAQRARALPPTEGAGEKGLWSRNPVTGAERAQRPLGGTP